MMYKFTLLWLFFLIPYGNAGALSHLQLAVSCKLEAIDAVNEYYVSEKYDGVRAYWDGERFLSRAGKVYAAPNWFTKGFPETALDGELWLARGQFAQTSSIVRNADKTDQWRKLHYLVFDSPQSPRPFKLRLQALQKDLNDTKNPYIQVAEQQQFSDKKHLLAHLEHINQLGGEGLMLHHQAAFYQSGRNPLLCKLKRFYDAEAKVIGYTAGKGKYEGLMGAVWVENAQGLQFKIGSGFSDLERKNPPKIGATVTYRYNGFSKNGLPRFVRFWRIRPVP